MSQRLLVSLSLAALLLGGCIRLTPAAPPSVAGVFKSYDQAEHWVARNQFLHTGGVGTISGISITRLFLDPQDVSAIYAGTAENGLLYTYDSGESWMQAKGLTRGRVLWVAVDPQDKCTIYATLANTILKSLDCSRSWREMYVDTVSTKSVTSLVVDRLSPNLVYAGNSAGDILKSEDGGTSWRVVTTFKARVMSLLADLSDSRILYAATDRKGIFKTSDAGQTWADVNVGLKPFSSSLEYKQLVPIPDVEHGLLLVSKYGLLVSSDGGETWQAIKLITPPASADIFAAAVNPKNSREIYYATASTFYKTVDGGVNWVTKRLPSTAVPSFLLINPDTPNLMYMAQSIPPKK